ncbi:hypothetical protein PC116_g19081 [Phytophthora cactorum]|uniref:Crossover junction endonuclease MUS81 n=1 Tax=Phytophthora cactorum TaxID=29920 RepID=A0A8T1K7M5_9STRA|nr:hypothetical protein PC112_g14970 [Phytophthora cactorum]KAG2817668.1 hypothetical protein PC111_g12613 [Phytophthora cactorum]KAG2852298.1 hypothetical protein PC113_g15145 [Phytophthora cactorum]KAG2974523.1 hypothetical protein PC118_g14470 [Phytophthora cactorum]KAG3154760.1 hypothetical protein C6341_g15613 [Phytophthora cactorum]
MVAGGCVHADNDPLVEDLLALKQRVRESTHLASNYARAITSVRAHPEPLRSAADAKKLRHIGNYMANQIHGILRKRGLLEAEDRAPSIAPPPTPVARAQADISTRDTSVGTPERSARDYAPAYRKQPWFVLLALQEAQAVDEDAAMASDALLQRMLDTGYEGNSAKLRACLASLSGTHEVVKRSNLGFYYLTQKGRRSAELCPGSLTGAATTTTTTTTTDAVTTAAASSAAASGSVRKNQTGVVRQRPSSPNWTYAELEDSDEEILTDLNTRPAPEPEPEATNKKHTVPEDLIRETDTWELVLLLDHREIIERRNPRILERKLLERNVNCEVRVLGVGDVQWIARRKRIGGETQEFMLNVIVERKEVHDLSGSIIDRRFFEQKTRLATRPPHGNGPHSGAEQFLRSAVPECRRNCDVPGSCVRTSSGQIPVESKSSKASDVTFAPFNSQFRKKNQFTVREIYQRMLLQAPGLSAAKTVGLSARYKNFYELERALRKRGRDREVEDVRCGKSQRRLGAKASESLTRLLTAHEYTEEGKIEGNCSTMTYLHVCSSVQLWRWY